MAFFVNFQPNLTLQIHFLLVFFIIFTNLKTEIKTVSRTSFRDFELKTVPFTRFCFGKVLWNFCQRVKNGHKICSSQSECFISIYGYCAYFFQICHKNENLQKGLFRHYFFFFGQNPKILIFFQKFNYWQAKFGPIA